MPVLPGAGDMPEPLRCPGCSGRRGPHDCAGRRDAAGRPLCSCIRCHGAAIRADLELYNADPLLIEARRYIKQQRLRAARADTWPAKPRIQTCEAPYCGRKVVSRRFGPRRRYCPGSACRQRAYRHRRAERERAGTAQDRAEPIRAGRTPGRTGEDIPVPIQAPTGRSGASSARPPAAVWPRKGGGVKMTPKLREAATRREAASPPPPEPRVPDWMTEALDDGG